MDLERKFENSEPDWEMKQKLWNRFLRYLDSINNGLSYIRYPNYWYRLCGIISPRQIIAWEKLINIIGCEAFKKIPVSLNCHSDSKNIVFRNEYEKYKENFKGNENFNITFTCGYFWKHVNKKDGISKRDIMMKFVNGEIENGCKVNIYTQDKSLKKEISKKMARNAIPRVKTRSFRMDVHSTIVEPMDKSKRDKTFLSMEFPHTERTEHRLEAHVTIEKLKGLGCNDKQINELLRFLKEQRRMHFFTKSIPSFFNVALK